MQTMQSTGAKRYASTKFLGFPRFQLSRNLQDIITTKKNLYGESALQFKLFH